MPTLSNARHERFARELAQGKSATEAYLVAGYKATEESARRCASDLLLTNHDVKSRVAELQQPAAAKAGMTLESLIAEAAEIQTAALAADNHSAAIAALTAKAKLGGLWIERAENKNETVEHVIGRQPRAVEDWADKHSATDSTAH